MFKFFLSLALTLPALAACSRSMAEGPGGGGSGAASPIYEGPSASPYCGADIYERVCKEWRGDAVPYCYGPAKHGDVGPAPFHSCATVTGGDAPSLSTNENGWASWWCCPFHDEGDGGSVVLDGGMAGGGGLGGSGGTGGMGAGGVGT